MRGFLLALQLTGFAALEFQLWGVGVRGYRALRVSGGFFGLELLIWGQHGGFFGLELLIWGQHGFGPCRGLRGASNSKNGQGARP